MIHFELGKSFCNSPTTCPNSGKINLFIASFTAPDEPGVQKTALFPMTPALAEKVSRRTNVFLITQHSKQFPKTTYFLFK